LKELHIKKLRALRATFKELELKPFSNKNNKNLQIKGIETLTEFPSWLTYLLNFAQYLLYESNVPFEILLTRAVAVSLDISWSLQHS
jgi:hypothetical protein